MFCPQCGAEYREGFTECADCRVPLVWEKPRGFERELEPDSGPEPWPPAQGQPDLEFVTVLESSDPLLIGAAKSLLEGAGIPFYVVGDEVSARYTGHHTFEPRRVLVGSDREAEAHALLERFV